MTVWFTVKLDDKPGSLARVAAALGERGVNITGIVGVAEDTDGALMLTTSDAAGPGRRLPRSAWRSRSTTRRPAWQPDVDVGQATSGPRRDRRGLARADVPCRRRPADTVAIRLRHLDGRRT